MSVKNTVWNVALAFAITLLAGCGSESTDSNEGGEAPSGATCSAANEVCFNITIPADLEGQPEALLVGLYRALPPMGPPDVFPPFQVDMPELEPGQTFTAKMTVEDTGTFQAYTVLYMPNGGLAQWAPKAEIDFSNASEPFELTGEAYNHSADVVLEIAN